MNKNLLSVTVYMNMEVFNNVVNCINGTSNFISSPPSGIVSFKRTKSKSFELQLPIQVICDIDEVDDTAIINYDKLSRMVE